jgi:hypothetical protein
MITMYRPISFALTILTLTACASGNVRLGEHVRAATPPADGSQVVRLYYDRNGDLYPGTLLRVAVPNAAFDFSRDQFQLKKNFEWHRAHRQPSFWDNVLDSLGLAPMQPDATLWAAIQDSLNNRAVVTIGRVTQRSTGEKRNLVVLVHGFNNSPQVAEESYAGVREHLSKEGYTHPDRTAYLQLYWDGLTNDIGIPIWRNAQFNFPLVGVSFRRVLNRVPHQVPVRVITHSSGGPLISNTLWDASWPIQPNEDTESWPRYKWYYTHVGTTSGLWAPPTHPDLRVGMIVPAMPGETFKNFNAGPGGPSRIIIGANPNDLAIRKLGVPTSWSFWQLTCRQSGSTCLSARRNQYCKVAVPEVHGDPDTKLGLVDFSQQRYGRDPRSLYIFDKHGVAVYLQRKDMSRFLEMVFADEPVERGDEHIWCG